MTEKTTSAPPVILWFRTDLRLDDHPGVAEALRIGAPILPIFIWDESLATRPLGAASRWWLHHSLKVLHENLVARGSRLIIERGHASVVLGSLVKECSVKTVICSKTFDTENEESDRQTAHALAQLGVDLNRVNATLLTEPNALITKSGTPFRVFTPFYKALEVSGALDIDALALSSNHAWPSPEIWPSSLTLSDLRLTPSLTPSGKDWSKGFGRFTPGEDGARAALRHFITHGLVDYADGRDRPDLDLTSHLSAHLRFGEISPQRVLHDIAVAVRSKPILAVSAAKFRSELAWREFCYGLLAQQPRLHEVNFRRDFDDFEWRTDEKGFRAWCRGETGYELVDAGMRELWQTGYMHNRVRMVVASFLVKHLLIDWRRGEKWFWDCLVDADPANNTASWQWVAGCGADAAPYFRVFNPISQAEKFDPRARYRARYIAGYQDASPKAKTETRDLFGSDAKAYPQPIVDHAFARDRALEAYRNRGQEAD
ncbi:deoxyribodipyrimidine photo-lyase [Asticcacaulis sp. 201]|uniref:cryptochrome/photolyase family protein n=1 Tax=Asticcacaulis sp. 201 TaxID=3028787 RepID=UPI0029169D2A|nr:deoxyribodipyrimidine photo-lyase [Asticcacaulis sp. 201]MDV6329394.1 deoxyribodipyrimidine photo-lyase [Asticcacaulis sp. 201]